MDGIISECDKFISLLRQLMRYWKTQLGIWNEGKKKVSLSINMCGFLQGDSNSQVGFS